MIGGAKGIGIGIDFGIPNQYCRATSKPYIEKDVLDSLRVVASAYGKSNNDADRSIVKNLVDASNPFIISNTAFKLNSGFGEYEQDFTDWEKSPKVTSFDSESIKFTSDVSWLLLYHPSSIGEDIPSFKVRIKLYGEGTLYYNYITQEGTYTNVAVKSEIFETPICYNTKYTGEKGVNVGFTLGVISGECSGTIEQIPSFEGAFVTDGIDDLITSTKTVQEMLGGSTEFTAVSMIHLISPGQDVDGAAYTNYIRTSDNYWTSNRVSNVDKTGIYGYSFKQSTPTVINNILGDKGDYTTDKSPDTTEMFRANFSVEGFEHAISGAIHVSSVAWYWTVIANKILTTDQINQVIAYFNLDRTLNPDILCNTIKQGITNENHAEFGDKLIDFSDNGRDIQLNNIAWKGDSGIGKYETDFTTWTRSHFTDEVNFTPSKIEVTGILTTNSILINNKPTPIYNVEIHSPNKSIVVYFQYNDDTGVKRIALVDGINELPSANDSLFVTSDRLNSKGITITQIPSHAGGLCLDGINDFGKVTGMPIYKDYTVIADYERFYLEPITGGRASILSKSSKVGDGSFIFNLEDQDGGKACYTFGGANGNISDDITRIIRYQSKYYNTKTLSIGTAEDNDFMVLGKVREVDSRHFCGAIYSLMSFPYSMSEFLIERQLKKHKLGTLYPDMVEFRPIVKSNNKWNIIEIWQGDKSLYRPAINDNKTGIYLKKDSTIGIFVKPYVGQKVREIVYNGVSYTDLKLNSNGYYYKVVPITKSPQKITMTIEQDENYVQWNPTVESNVGYSTIGYLNYSHNLATIKVGDYIGIGDTVAIRVILGNTVDEVVNCKVNGQECEIVNVSPKVFDCKFTITSEFPQKINITIDEYIRYEDIVQPYPLFFEFTDENGNLISWGGKAKVGSTITRTKGVNYANLLEGLFTITNPRLNGVPLASSQHVVEKSMVFTCTATWAFDNNEPKCILSPRLLRIPNSSYKILGYIPDISGHGNHGKINNSAYAEGSGVNEDGSYQFDGVDDFVTIPTIVGGKQVLMKVNWQSDAAKAILYDQRGYNNEFAIYNGTTDSDGNPIPAYQGRNDGQTYIDGILNSNIKASELKAITHNITITNELSLGTNNTYPVIGTNKTVNDYYANMALYDFMLFDNISTDDKIKELNEYVGVEAKVEKPDYYWDAYGKTNLDEDKATIQQRGIAVGDYDLTNYNHVYNKMSGYGGYSFKSFNDSQDWNIRGDGTGVEIVSRDGYSITIKKLIQNLDWQISNNEYRYPTILDKELPFKCISNKKVGLIWQLKYKTEGAISDTTVTLINQQLTPNVPLEINLPYKTQDELTELGAVSTSVYYLLCFSNTTLEIGEEYTVEMLPLYPNGLLYDGVTDYSENVNIPTFNDFTLLVKASLLNGFIGSGGSIAKKGSNNKVIGGGYDFVYALDSSAIEDNRNSYWSFGAVLRVSNGAINPPLIGYMTKNNVNGVPMSSGANPSIEGITFSKWEGYIKMVLYKAMLYPKTIPLLQINFLKNLMEKDEIIDLTNPIFIK
jgi:hypothetical protein